MAAQIVSVIIFIVMFLLIVTERIPRHYVTIGCGLLMMIVVFGIIMRSPEAIIETLNVRTFADSNFWILTSGEESSSGINWATIIFIFGMMVMVEGMAKAGFFRWLCLGIAKLVKYKTSRIFVTFMIMSFVLAMFIDSITVILFLAAVTIELSQLLKFSPIPMIIAEIFCANLGGSATMCGDPPNIIIGTALNYTFGDFLVNTGLIAVISLVFILVYFYLVFRKDITKDTTKGMKIDYPDPAQAIVSKKNFVVSSIIFGIAIILLVSHAATGLTVATIGILVALLTLATAGRHALSLLKKVDYETLLFFLGLFVVVGGLEQTGILELIANLIAKISGDNVIVMVSIVLFVSAIASAFVDNIPFAATMIPIIKTLSVTMGVDLSMLSWTLAMGTDVGGSATPIGASANVVGISAAAKNGHMIGWGKYCKYSVPATIIVIAISMAIIYIRYL